MKRKWQSILSRVLTLTMLFSTFQTTGLAAYAEDGEEEMVAEIQDDPEVGEPDRAGAANEISTLAVTNVTGYVGQAIEPASFIATMGDGTPDGAEVTWKLYKADGTTEATLPDGLTATTVATVDGVAKYIISGTPTKALEATTYKIGAKGAADNEFIGSSFTIRVDGIILHSDGNTSATALDTGSFTRGEADSKVIMGYTVADKLEDADKFADKVYSKVVPKKIVIKNDDAVVTVSDLKFSVENTSPSDEDAYFTVSPATATLGPEESVELTIVPAVGLECKGTDATYSSKLVIESDMLNGGKNDALATMELVVTSDLSATVVKDGTEVKAETDGSYKLVTVKVCETLSQNITISTKGSKDPEWLDGELVAINTPKADTSLTKDTGLKVTLSADGKTYTLSGTVAAVPAGEYVFTLNSMDSLGNTKAFTNAFIVTVEEADMIYTIGEEGLGNSLAWEAVKTDGVTTTQINAASKEITVTNNSGSAVTLTPSHTNTDDFEISSEITVQPGQNGKVTISPKASTLGEYGLNSDTLTISGNGVKTKTVKIQLDVLPEADTLNIQGNCEEVLTGEVGVNKSYYFKLNKADDTYSWDFDRASLKAAGLSIKKNADGSATISGVPTTKTSGAVYFTVYYYNDVNNNNDYDGVGEELKASKRFKIEIKPSGTAVEAKNGEDILTGVKDEDKLKTTIKTLDLGVYNTDYDTATVKTLSGNVALTNKLPLVLGTTTLAVANEFMSYDAKERKYAIVGEAITVGGHSVATNASLFTVVKADGTALPTVNLTSGAVDEESGKAEFWVIPNEAVLKYLPSNKYRQAITITPADSANVGTYTIYVDVEVGGHSHVYSAGTNERIPGKVEWKWIGDDRNGYEAELTLYCIEADCPDPEHGKQVIKAAVEESIEETHKIWTATVSYCGEIYTNVREEQNTPSGISYTVRFDMNGHGTVIPNETVKHGSLLSRPEPDPVDNNYDFGGWYTDKECTKEYDFSQKVTKKLTLYAKWTAKAVTDTFTVSFDTNGHGTAIADVSVKSGELLSRPEPDPVDDNYDFGGWYTDKECTKGYDFGQKVTENFTLYAKWTKKTVPGPGPAIRSALDVVPVIEDDTTELYLVKGQKFIIGKDWSVKKDDKASKALVSISKKSGQLKAKKDGTATIWNGDRSLTLHISAPSLPKKLSLQITADGAESKALELKNPDGLPVYWFSAAPDVATVDQEGNVTAVSAGKAKVTAYINGSAYKCTVTVKEAVPAKERSLHMTVGTKKLNIKGVKDPVWSSADEESASFEKNKLTAHKAGDTILTATAADGTEYKVHLYVENITLSGDGLTPAKGRNKYNLTLKAGGSTELSFVSLEQPFVFKSSKPDSAFIDENGKVFGRTKGKSKFTTKLNGKTITVNVIVEE